MDRFRLDTILPTLFQSSRLSVQSAAIKSHPSWQVAGDSTID
ncbi:hypothetical protein [Snodgrassella gandavensis]|nr:hypothetical protein [Snodgrassella gandavensis]